MQQFQNVNDRKSIYFNGVPLEMRTPNVMGALDKNNFFTHPSSTKFHGAYEGGGFEHAKNVVDCLLAWSDTGIITWERERSPYLIGWWHDLCKVDRYDVIPNSHPDSKDGSFQYKTAKQLYPGHGELSVIRAMDLLSLDDGLLTEEERACIWWHMGPYTNGGGQDNWNAYGFAVGQFPNILWVHHADMWASKILEGKNANN